MKLYIATILLAAVAGCSAGRLDNTYLPPGSARTAGGNGNFLGAPRPAAATGEFTSHSTGEGNYRQTQTNHGQSHSGQEIPIVKFNNENNGDGNYQFEYETANGIQAQEAGQLKQLGQEEVNQVHGSYSYTGDDGQQYTVTYTADENGFQPQGAHLPTPPPIPEAILRSLELNAAQGDDGNDGRYDDAQHGRQQQQQHNSNSGYRY